MLKRRPLQRKLDARNGKVSLLMKGRHTHIYHKNRNQTKHAEEQFTITDGRQTQKGEHLACGITGSHSRLANDGTWLGCSSLAGLRGGTEGGGTPDVEADLPNLQLDFSSGKKMNGLEKTSTVS